MFDWLWCCMYSPCAEPNMGTEWDLVDLSDLHVLDFGEHSLLIPRPTFGNIMLLVQMKLILIITPECMKRGCLNIMEILGINSCFRRQSR